jgi:group I intron endonuclease
MPKVSISHKGTICIYGILSPTGKIYIGQTWDLYHRYKSGVSKSQRLLYRSYHKHGEDAHKLFIIIDFRGPFTQSDLDYWERYYIEVYKAEGYQLLNIREGGGNNGKIAEETKRIVGAKSKQYHLDNPEWSKKNIQKLIESNKGSKRTKESKEAISKALRGHKRSEEHCKNISLAKRGGVSPFKGKTFSQSVIDQIRNNRKGKGGVAINQFTLNGEFIRQWDTIKSAAEHLKLHPGTINGCALLKPSYKSCGGFIWRYADFDGIIQPVIHTHTYSHTKRPVIQCDLGGNYIMEYESIKEAARHHSNETSIRYSCEGKQKTAGGFTWRYK